MKVWLRYLLSYGYDFLIERKTSALNGTLEVRYHKGKYILDSEKANYSFASLHRVFQKTFRHLSLKKKEIKEVLILGFGGGSVAHILTSELHLNMDITGIEHDPVILELSKKYFNSSDYKHLTLLCIDASDFVHSTTKKFDLIVVDLFKDTDVPRIFMEPRFIHRICNVCANNGTICFNFMIDSAEKREKIKVLTTLFQNNNMKTEIFTPEKLNRVFLAKKLV